MDKENANPAVLDAVDYEFVGSKRGASVLDAVLSRVVASAGALAAPVGASEAAAGGGQISPEWDPYEKVSYICPSNPYDTCMDNPWNEVSGSDVGSDKEDEHTKARQVLRRLQVSQYTSYFAKGVYKCPFCTRRLGGTDFNCILMHADNGRTFPNIGTIVNVYSFRAKHKVLGIHLRNFQQVEIAVGRMPPIKPKVPKIKGQVSNNWRKSQIGSWRPSINFNQFLEKEKLKGNGSNFTDWSRHVRIFLTGVSMQFVLEAPLGPPPPPAVSEDIKNVYETRVTRSEGKIFVAKNGSFLEKEFLTKEVTGRKVELDEVDEPSLIDQSSAVPEEVPVQPTPIGEEANDDDHETSNEEATEPRRSTRERTTPDWYDSCLNVMIADNNDEDPATYEEAMMSPDSNKWQKAMKSEMGSMYENKVWTLVDLPDSRKAVENKWIFKRKTDADGKPEPNPVEYLKMIRIERNEALEELDYRNAPTPEYSVEDLIKTVIEAATYRRLTLEFLSTLKHTVNCYYNTEENLLGVDCISFRSMNREYVLTLDEWCNHFGFENSATANRYACFALNPSPSM
ncbi:hypothetical protein QYE76_044932 [Lolium multiflorum]|uniref:Uncharacterized protein n=1 Tax=Lolium multiflorum TaxID=4521 RepID=A0AAD8TJL1_LOLMU|nr:hypothetical protein QYE76_044932 [Lolium multiflorum]